MNDDAPPGRTSDADPLLGQLVAGKFKVLRLIARGGMGKIYQAEQVGLHRSVALKVLSPRVHEVDPYFERRFIQEAATCGRLRHPNTVVVYDHGTFDDNGVTTLFMAMEFLHGPTLRQVLTRGGALLPARAVALVIGIARSLREAHAHGVVHRDLKPANLMLIDSGDGERVKVVDFGVAKVLRADTESLTLADRVIGSPRYMAPEQIRNQRVDGRTDLYALGVVLFEMLAGTPPFASSEAVETMMSHLNLPFPTLAARSGREFDPDLEQIVRRCCEKNPDHRFADAAALLVALRAWQERTGTPVDEGERSVSLPLPEPPEPAPTGLFRRPHAPGWGLAAAAAAGALAIALSTSAQRDPVIRPIGASLPTVEVVFLPQPDTDAAPELTEALQLAPDATRSVTVEPAPVLVSSPWELPPVPASPAVSYLTLTSHPLGAQVWEAETLRGVTPLVLPWATESVRVFTLVLPDYAVTTVTQDRIAEDTRRSIKLRRDRSGTRVRR